MAGSGGIPASKAPSSKVTETKDNSDDAVSIFGAAGGDTPGGDVDLGGGVVGGIH